jgi:hypothetical protein
MGTGGHEAGRVGDAHPAPDVGPAAAGRRLR